MRPPSRYHAIALNKVFRYALWCRLIAYNPCDAVDFPRATNAEGAAPVFLTAGQGEQVVRVLKEYAAYGLLMRFAEGTSPRAAEPQRLCIRDLNLGAGYVQVRQPVRRANGEGQVSTAKSARSIRNVPLLSRSLIAGMREYLLAHRTAAIPACCSGQLAATAFDARRSRNIDCGGVRAHHLVAAAQGVDAVKHLRFHDLRNTRCGVPTV